jgi:peptide/nickel transport system substrate-binding protein
MIDPTERTPGARVTRRHLMQRGMAVGVSGALLPTLLSACGGSSGGATTLRVGTTERLDSLNPFVTQQNVTWGIMTAIYPTLTTQVGPAAKTVGNFADSWRVAPDGLRYELKMRTGGRWTDGKPLTAKDAAFTLNTLVEHADDAASATSAFMVGIKRASAPDDGTLVIEMNEPSAGLFALATCYPILPQHVWAPLFAGSAKGVSSYQVDTSAVTCGPFRLKAFNPDGVTLLDRYDGGFGAKPHLQRVGFSYQASDAAMLNGLQTGSIDTIDWSGNYIVGIGDLGEGYSTKYGPSGTLWYLGFNLSPDKTSHRELQDLRVRTALAHATDRKAIVDAVLDGHGDVGGALIPPSASEFRDTSIEPEAYDVALANAQLDGLGFAKGSDGVRVANGQRMSYKLVCARSIGPSVQRVSEIVADGWRKAGVELSVRILDTPAMIDATLSDKGYQTNDVYIWYQSMLTDPSFLLSALTESQLGGYNDSHFIDAEYDRLWKQQSQELDVPKRIAQIKRMQQIVFDQKPILCLANPSPFAVTRAGFADPNVTSGAGAFPSWANGWPYELRAV